MAMEFQLTTDKAITALKRVETSLDTLKAKLDGISSSAGLDEIGTKLKGMTGIPKDVTDSLAALSNGLGRLSAASKLPLGGLTAGLGGIHAGATQATGSVTRLGTAAQGTGYAMQTLVAGAVRGGGSMNVLSIAALGARGALISFAAVGVVAAVAGMTALATKGTELTFTAQRMTAMLDGIGGKGFGADSLQFLQKVARETAVDIEVLTKSWAMFAPQALLAGKTGAETAVMFQKFTGVIKGFGLSGEQAGRAFYALAQIMAKGKFSAEELNSQLGDAGIPAIKALEEAVGVSNEKLIEMMRNGEIGAQYLAKFIDVLHTKVAGGLKDMMASAETQVILLENRMKSLAKSFSDEMWRPLAEGMKVLNNALELPMIKVLMMDLGTLTGMLGGLLLVAVGILVFGLALLASSVMAVYVVVEQLMFGALYLLGYLLVSTYNGIMSMIAAFMEWYNGTSMMATILRTLVDYVILGVTWIYNLFASTKDLQKAAEGSTGAWQAFYLVLWVVAEGIKFVWNMMKTFIDLCILAAKWLGFAGRATYDTSEKISVLSDKFNVATTAMDRYGRAAGKAGDETAILGRTTTDVSASVSGMNEGLSRGSSYFQNLANDASHAASSTRDLASAMKEVQSSGHARGPGDYYGAGSNEGSMIDKYNSTGKLFSTFTEFMMDGHKDGGIVGQGSKKQYPVARLGVFNSAPRLATGTANTSVYGTSSGGGIPIIAHPNEAVVPLGAGGSIPVSMSGGGGMSPQIAMKLSELCTYSKRTIQELTIVNENINQNGVLMKNESDRVVGRLDILGGLLGGMAKSITDMGKSVTDSLSRLETTMSKINTSSSSGGGSGSNSGGGSGGFGAATGFGERDTSGGFGKPMVFGGAGAMAGTSRGSSANLDLVAESAASGKYQGSFATGSPNAYDEVRKGQAVNAVIHPDEAIIPLPDGRRVPVDFRGLDLSQSGDSRSTNTSKKDHNDGITIINHVNMTIQTPDAASFRATQDQTLQEFAVNLERVSKKIGKRQSVDDPTRRTN